MARRAEPLPFTAAPVPVNEIAFPRLAESGDGVLVTVVIALAYASISTAVRLSAGAALSLRARERPAIHVNELRGPKSTVAREVFAWLSVALVARTRRLGQSYEGSVPCRCSRAG
jgi:hypothetical protein